MTIEFMSRCLIYFLFWFFWNHKSFSLIESVCVLIIFCLNFVCFFFFFWTVINCYQQKTGLHSISYRNKRSIQTKILSFRLHHKSNRGKIYKNKQPGKKYEKQSFFFHIFTLFLVRFCFVFKLGFSVWTMFQFRQCISIIFDFTQMDKSKQKRKIEMNIFRISQCN